MRDERSEAGLSSVGCGSVGCGLIFGDVADLGYSKGGDYGGVGGDR